MRQSLLLCAAILCATLPLGIRADLLRVPDEYSTITLACEDAVSGDTVAVSAGLYHEDAYVNPGVSVIGMVPDSTEVHVSPLDYQGPFTILEGTDATLIENMTILGGLNPTFYNGNPNTVIKRCFIVAGDSGSYVAIVGADLTIKSCFIWWSSWSDNLFWFNGPFDVLIEDCVLRGNGLNYWNVPSGTRINLKNNTIDDSIYFYVEFSTDFSLIFTNNIMKYVQCGDVQPDTLEWRYNDFVEPGGWPNCGEQAGNFSADPLLCDPDGEVADYRLEPESPCLGAGENGEDVGARLGICWDPSGVGDEQASGLDSRLRAYPTVIGGDGCTLGLTGQSVDLSPAVEVLDVLGRRCATVTLSPRAGATFTARWPGTDDQGRKLPAGVYWLRPTGRTDVSTRVHIVR
ncbi:MAG: hypothetical protein KJ970_10310 [Candidatus Eisenbacteria bacterium]|uniref:Right-handed parallel beta-helix repeat-containing protein n=1 Tax=Eiseniibacteriota bacterium TaxID=2212470 RepID=A0A948RUL6_UNCEI|nr:hypothetical protein [Candidatus Eisenbacteria bacterium]MBU1949080.1 hypothetical protein [Candidatus Eisenbacteria bacterium]MBU2691310.1 hypothetical protein [Candidatus Eisenbacteria bacterium]